MPPRRDWYHVTGNTYGAWLPGDARGWKTRHHRRHIDEINPDRAPPPLRDHVRRRLSRPPITLSVSARRAALNTILETLRHHTIEVVAAAVAEHHFHLLARFPDHKPRHWAGLAKKDSARALSSSGHAPEGGVWAVRTHCNPITDRDHQLQVARYIADHERQGAAIWAPWRKTQGQQSLG